MKKTQTERVRVRERVSRGRRALPHFHGDSGGHAHSRFRFLLRRFRGPVYRNKRGLMVFQCH
uniref:Uncharacterized protein n=1 Tax=Triticum urartu TaxID=4572 RepID=A0A8R7V987_TRIUA